LEMDSQSHGFGQQWLNSVQLTLDTNQHQLVSTSNEKCVAMAMTEQVSVEEITHKALLNVAW